MEQTREKARFVWPPNLLPDEAVQVRPIESTDPTIEAKNQQEKWWTLAERALFDPIAEPLRVRAARQGWTPDRPGEYCDRCGVSVGPHESDEMGCSRCLGRRLKWSRVVRLGAYDDPLSRWIQEVKFTRWCRLGIDLGRWLGESIRTQEVFGEQHGSEPPVVVAMPTSFRRRLSRGIDHAGVIARGVSTELGLQTVHALGRTHRMSQRRIPVSKRPQNVRGSLVFKAKTSISKRQVILVDDVLTTGATASEAARVLVDRGGAAGVVVGVLSVTGE